jgi:NTP pyrophosphatase (non-canonical NTP hydrolase)
MAIRDQANDFEIESLKITFSEELEKRIKKHGKGKFISPAESLGVLCEEYKEVIDAVQSNITEKIFNEMIDVAVASMWAVLSLNQSPCIRCYKNQRSENSTFCNSCFEAEILPERK